MTINSPKFLQPKYFVQYVLNNIINVQICQSLFRQLCFCSDSPKFAPTKVSFYTVICSTTIECEYIEHLYCKFKPLLISVNPLFSILLNYTICNSSL